MKANWFVSEYIIAQFKSHIDKGNESKVANLVKREFKNQPHLNVAVSNLTYVRVGLSWHYICILIDLFNREIIGYSIGRNNDTTLVSKAFGGVRTNLNNMHVFDTNRGNKFKNKAVLDIIVDII